MLNSFPPTQYSVLHCLEKLLTENIIFLIIHKFEFADFLKCIGNPEINACKASMVSAGIVDLKESQWLKAHTPSSQAGQGGAISSFQPSCC